MEMSIAHHAASAIARTLEPDNWLAAMPRAADILDGLHSEGMAVLPVGSIEGLVGQVEALARSLEACRTFVEAMDNRELMDLVDRALSAVG